ncbi:MAG: glycerol-3-phosphate dehydrogenase/oxidase [Anaerolineales bacterium]
MNRSEILASLQSKSPDVLIIGGGINGAGVFRDLALNGVDVLLIDRADFCSGASAASSHMAHGGIRYLENGEFRLVREAVQERNRMIENAPHLVRPLPTVVPMFKIFSGLLNAPLKFLNLLDRPAERGALVIKIGLIFYDQFTKGQGTVPPHKFEGRARSLEKYPKLHPGVKFTATYYDGQILSPERYTVELILDAEAEGPHARALNYVSFAGGEGSAVVLQDEVSGERLRISPRLIINAAGPWIDLVNASLGLSRRYIGGTKGSHLVLDHPELRQAIGQNEFFFENNDGRIVLLFPFYDKVIVGTSDIPIQDPDSARCTDEEIDYFLKLTARVFPNIRIGREHIVFQFSGVRPLEYVRAKTTGQITRDHSIKEDSFNGIPVYSLVGGKWTSYRAFGEQVTDKVLALFGLNRRASTRNLPIGGGQKIEINGGRDFPITGFAMITFLNEVERQTGVGGPRLKTLFDRYGTRVREVAAHIGAGPDSPLPHKSDWSRREVDFLATHEKVIHLDDLLIRRSTLAWLGALTRPALDDFADALGESLGWSAAQKQAEIQRTLHILADRHGVVLT